MNNAISFFNVNLRVLNNQWASLNSIQPVAWSNQLEDSAKTHTDLMIDFDQQSHNLPGEAGLFERVQNAGYSLNTVGENIYAFADSPFHGHAGFAIDWGNTSTGIQNPPGHRDSIMNLSLIHI